MPSRLKTIVLTLLLAGVVNWLPSSVTAKPLVEWWLVGSTYKVLPTETPPDDPAAHLVLHAARQEYAPFQIVFKATAVDVALTELVVDYPAEYFDLTLCAEQYLPLLQQPEGDVFTRARISGVKALPDGLRPLQGAFNVAATYPTVIWADLYVRAGTPAGEYPLRLKVAGLEPRTVTVTVYPVDLEATPSMSIILPLEVNGDVPAYGGTDPGGFHLAVNRMLLDHYVVPGSFLNEPAVTDTGWDFSSLDEEIAAIPEGAYFYAPLPYNEWTGEYLLRREDGTFYTSAEFGNPYFVAQAQEFFRALAGYLQTLNRLDGALIYAVDETRWVNDEPIHNGPAGFERVAEWSSAARAAGLRVTASDVLPVAPGPADLGWIETATVIDDSHVHVDMFDGALAMFQEWMSQPGRTASVYLNEYGDLIDLPAAIHRGLIWHVYARGSRMIAGYAGLEWVTEHYQWVDPWTEPERIYPVSGYGGGALLWPGPQPSLRLKLLREGVEDARLLDLYAVQHSLTEAQALARQLTPGMLAEQVPTADLWDRAHEALLVALTAGEPADFLTFSPLPVVYTESQTVADFDSKGLPPDWELYGVTGTPVNSPWEDGGIAVQLAFAAEVGEAAYYFGDSDWSDWEALQVDVQSLSPYVSGLDVGLVDGNDNFLLMRYGSSVIGPSEIKTLTFPLLIPENEEDSFDWSTVKYIAFQVGTTIEKRDGSGDWRVYALGGRTIVIDNIQLVRQ